MYQYLLARPEELCAIAATDIGVRVKTRLLWNRIRPLVGDAFLRQRASCVVPWLDQHEVAPARAARREPVPAESNPIDIERTQSRPLGTSSLPFR